MPKKLKLKKSSSRSCNHECGKCERDECLEAKSEVNPKKKKLKISSRR